MSVEARNCRPTRSFEDFFAHLKQLGVVPEICIDVGAANGTVSIYQAFPKAKHFVFEPLPDFQDALRETLKPYDAKITDCALTNEPGESTLLRHADLFGSSIMHNREVDDERVVGIRTSTLDIELAEVDLADKMTLLKTDCQGSDLLVLSGGEETLKHCDIVLVEASLFRFWGEHQADFYDIMEFMNAAGFALYDILDGLYRPLDSALGQLDLAFVKKQGPLRRAHYW
nr:FkbM family methyltransferase [Hyphomonas sp. Mor2]